ncbi:hypothetical protein ACOZGD_37610 [Streptomyces murinus]
MEIPDELISLERAAEDERARLVSLTGDDYAAQWRQWRGAAQALQVAVTAHAEATGTNRFAVEQAVKTAARHAQEEAADDE